MELDHEAQSRIEPPPNVVLNVTDVSQYVFCPRQFYLSKILDVHRQSPEFIEGTLEHDVRRLLSEALAPAYIESGPNPAKLSNAANAMIGKALDYAKNIALLQHPIFSKEIAGFVQELWYRLHLEEDERVQLLLSLVATDSWAVLVQASFPVETELSVFSSELGIRGRIDEVFRNKDGSIGIRDVKTSAYGFPFDQANQVQLATYAMILEKQTAKGVTWAKVYSSRSLAERRVIIGEELKKRVLDAADNARRLLASPEGPPSILSGPEAVKCDFCFLREECQHQASSKSGSQGL